MAQRKKNKGINDWVSGLGDTYVTRNLLFFLFLALLGLFYISNSHMQMKRLKELNKMTSLLKEKRWYYVQSLSHNMQKTKLYKVKKDVAYMGLNELLEPPQIIKTNSKAKEK